MGILPSGRCKRREALRFPALQSSVILSAAKDLDSSVAALPQNDIIFCLLEFF